MPLINDTNTLRTVLPVGGNLKWDDIQPFSHKAETKYIIPTLGQDLYDGLLVAIDNNTASPTWAELITRCQRAIGFFAVLDYIPSGQLKISSAGIQISTDERNKTAFKWQIQALQQDCSNSAFEALDSVFSFLEENIAEFDDYWTDTKGFSICYENYIHTADVFTRNVSMLNGSRSIFMKLKPFMDDVEQQLVIGVLGTAQDTVIRTAILANTLEPEQKQAVLLLQRLIAYKSMAKALMILALRVDERGVFVFDATGSFDSNSVEKTADDSTIEKRVKYFEIEAATQEQLLLKYLKLNAEKFPEYTAMLEVSAISTYQPTNTDKVISFM
jgi:hypothetical protein